MSTHFDQFTSSCFLGRFVSAPGDALPLITFPIQDDPAKAAPCETRALVESESDDDDEERDDAWDDYVPGAETEWNWIDDADLFDDLFDDAEPLEDVDWADRQSAEDEDDL